MESAAREMLARIALVKPVVCHNTFTRLEVSIESADFPCDFLNWLRSAPSGERRTFEIAAPSLRLPVWASVLRANLASMKNLISMLATRTSQVSRCGLSRFHLMQTARLTAHGIRIETVGACFQK